jgi:hypothetical protein
MAYCAERVPQWNTISISGYHIREAGSTAAQELAFTLANGLEYIRRGIAALRAHPLGLHGHPASRRGLDRRHCQPLVAPARVDPDAAQPVASGVGSRADIGASFRPARRILRC